MLGGTCGGGVHGAQPGSGRMSRASERWGELDPSDEPAGVQRDGYRAGVGKIPELREPGQGRQPAREVDWPRQINLKNAFYSSL